MKKYFLILLLIISSSPFTLCRAQLTVIHDFTSATGYEPGGTLTLSGNVLYGMTGAGGAKDSGCIFSINTDGSSYTDLFDFNGPNGASPEGDLIFSGNIMFGMTYGGGAAHLGCIFSIDSNGSGYRDLFDFNGTNGANPHGDLILLGNVMIGMTNNGGAHGRGCIFSIRTDGSHYRDIHDFGGYPNDGLHPDGSLTFFSGKIFGMTYGGGLYDDGCVFSLDTNGIRYKVIFNFNQINGWEPIGSLTASGNKLFGMTIGGGTYYAGNIFSVDTDGTAYKELLIFDGTNGVTPYGNLVLSGSMLYGMSCGQPSSYPFIGNLFSIDTSGSGFVNYANFNKTDGCFPYGSPTLSGTTIYGMTSGGPSNLYTGGVIFSYAPCTFSLSASISSAITCTGESNGSVTATPVGGTSPYTYFWSTGETTQTITGLSAGTYTLSVTDANNCTGTASVTLTQPTAITITASATANVSCNGGSTGIAKADSASGGTPYEFIYDVAGKLDPGFTGDGGPATSAEIYWPSGVGVDASDNIYIADTYNSVIRLVSSSTGDISTYAGMGRLQGHGGDGGPATAAKLNYPTDVKVDAHGNIYIADQSNNEIREVNHTTGIITTIAGTYTASGYTGDGGQATAAELYIPASVAFDASGNIYIADFGNNAIREVNCTTGIITTIAGNGTAGYTGDGGNATAAELNAPSGVAVDASGNVYIADGYNSVIRKVNSSGIISTFAGNAATGYNGDGGQATAAELYDASGVAVDVSGNVFIADIYNNVVREVNPSTGIISTIAGDGYKAGTGNGGYSGNGGAATAAEMYNPTNIAVDNSGNIYIADTYNSEIREVKPDYNYVWSPSGGTSLTASNLSAGTYTITATDMNSCTGTAVVTISQPNQLSASATVSSNVLCYNGNTGSATCTVSGGTSPFTYSWSNSQTTSSVSSLSMGTYTLTVSDSCGATATATVSITQPNQLNVSANVISNVLCYGGSTGSASSTVSGGTTPYTYSWSNSQATPDISNLSMGTYTLNVTDSNGCTGTATVSITQPNQLNVSVNTTSNVLCYGGNTGSASSTVSGGTTPYTYSWSNSQATPDISNLSMGTYTLNVTDSNGCTGTATVSITQPSQLSVSANVVSNATCNGDNNGSATAVVSGGTSPYTYLWSGTITQSSVTATGLSAGSYTVTVTDSNGCNFTTSVNITQPTPLTYAINSDTAIDLCNGSCWITLSGGTPPYTYAWGVGGTTDSIANLCGGKYCVFVVDANGCRTATDSVCDSVPMLTTTGFYKVQNAGMGIIVYPNPNNGQFTIETSGVCCKLSVEIYNVLGEKVYSQFSTFNSQFVIDLSSKPSGIYFYRVLNSDGSALGQGKLIIQK